ncbi:hypothetical protein M446_6446 [Methylobacterium sp. 4-46]|nr:hypothetical protein M446_6446 [Methylobacterium sp. 4-46]
MIMKTLALTLTAAAALTGAVSSAQAYEWGDGYGPGYGHRRVVIREGYRPTRFYHRRFDDRPDVRVIERRSHGFRSHHHWDYDD